MYTRGQDSSAVEDTRIGDVRPLIPPACLSEDIPLSAKARETVSLSPAFARALSRSVSLSVVLTLALALELDIKILIYL